MMGLTCWEADARVVSLDEILSWCLQHHAVDHMLVAMRLEQVGNKWRYHDSKAGEFFQSQFGSYILTGFQVSEWPGTEPLGHPGFVFVLTFNEEVKELILRIQPSLSKWQHKENPPLPEDICLFKESAEHPVLVTRTHDLVAWVISDKDPKLQGFRKSNIPSNKLFPQGKYFYRKYKQRNTGRSR